MYNTRKPNNKPGRNYPKILLKAFILLALLVQTQGCSSAQMSAFTRSMAYDLPAAQRSFENHQRDNTSQSPRAPRVATPPGYYDRPYNQTYPNPYQPQPNPYYTNPYGGY